MSQSIKIGTIWCSCHSTRAASVIQIITIQFNVWSFFPFIDSLVNILVGHLCFSSCLSCYILNYYIYYHEQIWDITSPTVRESGKRLWKRYSCSNFNVKLQPYNFFCDLKCFCFMFRHLFDYLSCSFSFDCLYFQLHNKVPGWLQRASLWISISLLSSR